MQGYLIAGPARCGKSQMALYLQQQSGISASILTVDALLPFFARSDIKYRKEAAQQFLSEYLKRPRFMDAKRSNSRVPLDDMLVSEGDIINSIEYAELETAVTLIGKSLSQWTELESHSAWFAPDLHAELFYKTLTHDIPSLKLLVLLRDPREALAAALYWRTYPNRIKYSGRVFLHKLLLWCLAADVGWRYAKEMPGQVTVMYLNEVNDMQDNIFGKLLDTKYDSDARSLLKPDSLYFSYDPVYGFIGPDGIRSPLLTDSEIYLIETLTSKWFTYNHNDDYSYEGTIGCRANILFVYTLLRVTLRIARLDPVAAKVFIDFLLFPIMQVRKWVNRLGLIIKRNTSRLLSVLINVRRLWIK